MDFKLKKASPPDFPIIEKLAIKILSEHYIPIFGKPKTDYLLEKFYKTAALEQQFADGQIFYLAIDENDAAFGFCSFLNKGNGAFFIPKFYVNSEKQGVGVGSKMLQKMLAEMGDEMREIRLNVNRFNIKSINFYFKNRFFIEKWTDIDVGGGFEMNVFQMLFLKK
jgi:ribosomal protein S18 acetylase RimI-like enzyme